MSELIQNEDCRNSIHWKLLSGVSTLALIAQAATAGLARAEDSDRPTVWIELGGQLSRLQDGQETFAPSLMGDVPSIFTPSQAFEKLPSYGFDGSGSISIQPDNSNWIFKASIRYGRSKSNKNSLQQTNPKPFVGTFSGYRYVEEPIAQKFLETTTRNSEQHVILDFDAGKDIGLGLIGSQNATSVFSVGVRFAQFGNRSNVSLKSDPDWHFNYKYYAALNLKLPNGQAFHSNLASLEAERSFHGVGPSVSWKGSVPLAGNASVGTIMADWGLNAAVLFGRQRARTHHQSTARYFHASGLIRTHSAVPHTISRFPETPDHTRSRGVTVPNLGGFAGLSLKYTDAEVSFGYRADFFFGAMDGGIDARKTFDRNFYGPFATVSIGLGG